MARESPPIAQECVEAYLFCRPPLRLLILRRPPNRGRIWVPVSGKVDPSDADYPSAMRREIAEETGFTGFLRLFSLDWEVIFDGPNRQRWRLHAFGIELSGPLVPRLSREHEAFEWVTPEQAVGRLHYADNQEAVRRLVALLGRGTTDCGSPNV